VWSFLKKAELEGGCKELVTFKNSNEVISLDNNINLLGAKREYF
jgi:hypothetical protein